mmetsp:Transcript_14918/g.24395  ORF Transcript_14918/g.24395 Transcript_14918/m.24395 type:complete len:101 (+) Transcript_14918:56-358(+)|eukprot:CAMPEP_0169113384 /NCGR_PEP_ID=MMETSP1015-20121227/28178_1 /TAXON_ID=342587 /ORGANISM="Karlodinium micrum, Strain CCMP2283" /LENGTH=100 /DNA_ID=CAMNT_0009175561 /DNA_START=54 /DNA_END=356 /DNA_ORIENTATION=-
MEASPNKIQIASCALGGHLLGRGTAVQKAIQAKFPKADVQNTYGWPLQFSVYVDDKPVVSSLGGTCTILQLLTCCRSPELVAESVANHVKQDVDHPVLGS